MPNQIQLNHIFHALSDPTRMAVIAMLSEGSASVSELARPHKMALPSFTQHLDVLQQSGLVNSRKVGRVRTYELKPEALKEATNWLEMRRKDWESRLNRLDHHLHTLKETPHD